MKKIIEIENIGINNSVSALDRNNNLDISKLAERAMFNIESIMSDLKYFIENKNKDYTAFIKNEADKMMSIIEVGRRITH